MNNVCDKKIRHRGQVFRSETQNNNNNEWNSNFSRNSVQPRNHYVKNNEYRSRTGKSRLHSAIAARNVWLIRKLVDSGANINEFNEYGMTPLSVCVLRGYDELIQVLLDLGADLGVKDKEGQTALHIASRIQSPKVLKAMLRHCSENVINLECNKNKTALHYLMENLRANAEIVNLFMKHGAALNTGTRSECEREKKWLHQSKKPSAIHCFIQAKMKNFDVLEALLQNGADPNLQNEVRRSPLNAILDHFNWDGEKEAIKILLKYNADMNSGIPYSPFRRALTGNCIEQTKMFIEFGANVNEIDFQGYTPLHNAVNFEYFEIIELLLSHGADINIKSEGGETAFQKYYPYRNPRIFSRFWEHVFELKCTKQFVAKENLKLSERTDDSREESQKRCSSEIDRLKKDKIDGSNLTLHHIVTMNTNRCYRNEAILEKFESQEALETICRKYPIFSSTIRRNIEHILMVNEINSAIDDSGNLFKIVPLECTDRIFKYLAPEDLKFLSRAFSTKSKGVSHR